MGLQIWDDLDHRLVEDARGNFKHAYDADAVKGSINNILRTGRGERLMECWFGFHIDSWLFQTASRQKFDQLARDIQNMIEKVDPRPEITEVSTKVMPDENQIEITVAFRLREQSDIVYTTTSII